MKIAIFFILIVTGAVASSVTEESSNRIVNDSNLRGSVSIVEGAFQEQLEEKRDGNVKFMKDNEYAVQKVEDTKDLIFEPQSLNVIRTCICNGITYALCCDGRCSRPNHRRCLASVELMKDEKEDMTHDVPAEIAYPFVCHCTSDNVLCCFGNCYKDDSRCLARVKLMKDEEEDMAHQVSSELVTYDKNSVQKTEVEKDLDFEPQGAEEFVSIYCYCNSYNALCCLGSCGGPNGICSARGYPRVELMKDEEEDMTHDVPAEIAYPEFVEEETTCLLNGDSCYTDIFRNEVQKCCSGYCKSYAGLYVGFCRDSDIE